MELLMSSLDLIEGTANRLFGVSLPEPVQVVRLDLLERNGLRRLVVTCQFYTTKLVAEKILGEEGYPVRITDGTVPSVETLLVLREVTHELAEHPELTSIFQEHRVPTIEFTRWHWHHGE